MKYLKIICQTLVVAVAMTAAATLIYFDKNGWGWFIFISILTLLG